MVVVCLSKNSITKRGVVQQEIKRALDVWEQMPEGAIYLIPARLERCEVPDSLSDFHWVDLFESGGFQRLKQALNFEISKRKLEVRSRPIRQAADVLPLKEWTEAAQFANEAGKNLQPRFGGELLTAKDIQREIERLSKGKYKRGNILPADYCYNRINKARYSFRFPVFEWVERGKFRYLGPDYNYTGPVLWKPRGEAERQIGEWIGEWKSGVCCLWEDPRND
jgi:hypothetical protein